MGVSQQKSANTSISVLRWYWYARPAEFTQSVSAVVCLVHPRWDTTSLPKTQIVLPGSHAPCLTTCFVVAPPADRQVWSARFRHYPSTMKQPTHGRRGCNANHLLVGSSYTNTCSLSYCTKPSVHFKLIKHFIQLIGLNFPFTKPWVHWPMSPLSLTLFSALAD